MAAMRLTCEDAACAIALAVLEETAFGSAVAQASSSASNSSYVASGLARTISMNSFGRSL
jgi:hypothetical protein